MNAQQIVDRGVQVVKNNDTSFSHTGLRDFKEASPEIIKMEPKAPTSRPRTRASQNNSYT